MILESKQMCTRTRKADGSKFQDGRRGKRLGTTQSLLCAQDVSKDRDLLVSSKGSLAPARIPRI